MLNPPVTDEPTTAPTWVNGKATDTTVYGPSVTGMVVSRRLALFHARAVFAVPLMALESNVGAVSPVCKLATKALGLASVHDDTEAPFAGTGVI